MQIKIIKALPDQDHPLSQRESLIGLTIEANDLTVQWLREKNPHLHHLSNTYEVALNDLIEALFRDGRNNALIYWNGVTSSRIIYFPHDCAEVVLEPEHQTA